MKFFSRSRVVWPVGMQDADVYVLVETAAWVSKKRDGPAVGYPTKLSSAEPMTYLTVVNIFATTTESSRSSQRRGKTFTPRAIFSVVGPELLNLQTGGVGRRLCCGCIFTLHELFYPTCTGIVEAAGSSVGPLLA